MEEQCKDCRFFKPRDEDELDHDDGVGMCRRYPPVVLPLQDDETHETYFGIYASEVDLFRQPYVESYFWCGEFKRPNVK